MTEFNPYQVSESSESGTSGAFEQPSVEIVSQPIGGWLYLVGIGLVFSPIRLAALLATTYLHIFSNGTWRALTTPGSASYHPLWGMLIPLEVAGNVIMIVLALTALCVYSMKSKYTPRLVIGLLLFSLAFVVGDHFMAIHIPYIRSHSAGSQSTVEITRAIISVAIWVPYFLMSQRVKATFVLPWPWRRP